MNETKPSSTFRFMTGYYGVLQSMHLLLLARAGWCLLQKQQMPFPASPPPGGWPGPALPYLLGMGIVDLFAIGLGLVFAYSFFFRKEINIVLGLISLTAALSSGIVYLVGTIPSGAWVANPLSYLAVLLLFIFHHAIGVFTLQDRKELNACVAPAKPKIRPTIDEMIITASQPRPTVIRVSVVSRSRASRTP